MAKYPIYGFEKPYLEELKKELSDYADEIFYDNFDNLCVVKNSNTAQEDTSCVLFGINISDNAFLVNEIKDDGSADVSSLMNVDDDILGKKIVTQNGKTGILKGSAKKLIADFGYFDKKSISRYVKQGEVCGIKPYSEVMGDCYVTNSSSLILKNLFVALTKEYYSKKIVFAFLREGKKGIYALGKQEIIKCDEAYFINVCEDVEKNISFVKKEGSYISSVSQNNLPLCVLEKDVTNANQFYLSGKCEKVGGIVVKCEILPDKSYKIRKKAIEELKNYILKI